MANSAGAEQNPVEDMRALLEGELTTKDKLPPAPAQTTGTSDNDDTELQIARNYYQTEEQLARIGLQTKKDLLDQEVSAHQISKAQEIQQLMAFAAQEEQVSQQAVDQQASLYDQDSAEYAALMNKKKLIAAQFNAEIQKLAAQGNAAQRAQSEEQVAAYRQVFDEIGGKFDTVIAGILQGTQTWRQGIARGQRYGRRHGGGCREGIGSMGGKQTVQRRGLVTDG
jgi:hypothetical protein